MVAGRVAQVDPAGLASVRAKPPNTGRRRRTALRYDPITPLVESSSPAIRFWARRDLLDDRGGVLRELWESPPAEAVLRRQRPNGSWKYPAARAHVRTAMQYDLLETYRQLGELVEKFGMNRRHPALQKAADYIFRSQSRDGDLRGIYGNQYSPNYTAGFLELLIKAGYGDDPRVVRSFEWLLRVRQSDGGWAIPLRTRNLKFQRLGLATISPDPSKPFSHLVTGVVLRAFAAHPRYRRTSAARTAAGLLVGRFFQADAYPDRGTSAFWTGFSFPFWFTDLISALDSLSRVGWPADDPNVERALQWLAERQRPDRLFDLRLLRDRDKHLPEWLALAVCRVLKRFRIPL